ncbi:hypothetical protein CQ018_06550 [Arthrobacter sp. MYb227]|uniref:DUF503 domain-containing protein n=1 Tax=Arthrobacter sp. MYb227 TaxID=1848601 RepID=UPI000CFC67EA|nr:DUF503 domain-containing protein [Arthrobacter sp. MYb227]PQZ94991.1 hypothetical protein CQ018_06550 [Arthrobacter sp. MYb227]
MFFGWIQFDILLGDVQSLKEKRSVVRPIISEIKRKFEVSVAETGELDLYRRAEIAAGLVATDAAHVIDELDGIERLVAERPEIQLLSAGRRIHSSEDD